MEKKTDIGDPSTEARLRNLGASNFNSGEQQRQHLLREQLKLIQKELGIAKDDRTAELDALRERILELTLSEEAERRMRYTHAETSGLDGGAEEEPDGGAGKPETFVRSERKVGRNEPCPCGSGRKYKQCHGKAA